jgi:thiamine pyrophosphate-dependent acetolactate synthase large subunit-like protein
VARAFDLHGVWADNREVLESELRQAMERNKSTLIACPIGNRPYDGRF